MADSWKTIYEGMFEGRNIKVKKYDGGGYRVITTQKEDIDSRILKDDASTIIFPPSESGDEIHIDGETKEELIKEMMNSDFSENGLRNLISNL